MSNSQFSEKHPRLLRMEDACFENMAKKVSVWSSRVQGVNLFLFKHTALSILKMESMGKETAIQRPICCITIGKKSKMTALYYLKYRYLKNFFRCLLHSNLLTLFSKQMNGWIPKIIFWVKLLRENYTDG